MALKGIAHFNIRFVSSERMVGIKTNILGLCKFNPNTVVTETDLVKLQVLLRISKESYSILCSLFNGRDPENTILKIVKIVRTSLMSIPDQNL